MVENAKNMEKLRRLIKNNRFVRGFYMLVRMSFGVSRHKFGRCADGVILTPPFLLEMPRMFFCMIDATWQAIAGFRQLMPDSSAKVIAQ